MELSKIYNPALEEFINSFNPARILTISRFIDGGYGQKDHLKVVKKFRLLNDQSTEDILIIFKDCVGGGIEAGLFLYDHFLFSKAHTFGLVEKRADSSASIALLGCHKRYSLEEATFLLHEPIPFKGVDLKKFNESRKRVHEIYQFCSERSFSEVATLLKEGRSLSAGEAKQWKFIHGVI